MIAQYTAVDLTKTHRYLDMHCQFLLNHLYTGGAEIQTVRLANALVASGHRCDIVTLFPYQGWTERIAPDANVSVFSCDVRSFLDIRGLARLVSIVRQRRPDVLVAVNQGAMVYAHLARALARRRMPIVVTFHTTLLSSFMERWKMQGQRFFFNRSDMLIYVSKQQAASWRTRGLRAKADCFIHNGVDTDWFSSEQAEKMRDVTRHKLGLAASDYVIGYCANFRPGKNHSQLVDAVAQLRKDGCPAKALFVGEGPCRNAVEQYVRTRELSDAVVFAGEHKDVRPYIAAFDVGAICSIFTETFSLAALEIMAMGRPVVISKLGGAGEMVVDGENGFLFPAGDTAVLVSQLRLLYDSVRRFGMGKNARQMVVDRFSHEVMTRSYCEVFAALL